MRNYRIEGHEENEIYTMPFSLPFHALLASKDTYVNYPSFQRQEVWPDKFRFELIDSLVKGAYIPEILLAERTDGKPGYWVLDGQQRLQTMVQFMAALEADSQGKPIPRDEQGQESFYFRLTKGQEDRLRNRIIKFTKLQGVTDEMLPTIFLRLQNQVALSSAEKLWAAPSLFRDIAASIHEHPFYNQIYIGRRSRRQTFQMSIYPVMIEMYKPFTEMSNTRLRRLAEGIKSELITPGMTEAIKQNMDHVARLYDGIKAGAMTEIIPMYQSIWLLRFIGADLDKTETGALDSWYRKAVDFLAHRNSETARVLTRGVFTRMTSYKFQRQMWQHWLEDLVQGHSVHFGDAEQEKQAMAQAQRITGWLKRNGVCGTCGNIHVQLTDVERHVFRLGDEFLRTNCSATVKTIFSLVANE